MTAIKLPQPEIKKGKSVEECFRNRRSIREYKNTPLSLKEISQILWAADGKNIEDYGRTSPSAGATYPIEIYIACGNVSDISSGVYHYNIGTHSLTLIKQGDIRSSLSESALNQIMVLKAPATIIIAGVFEKTTSRYGERGKRYVFMEAGHCGQNIHLQAESLGLGTVMVGAFNDASVRKVLAIKEDVFYLCPVGEK
ncbi:nitroreductase [bacterium Unc6]|nr:nitroreductase [bacterium Unc6]